MNEDNKFQNPEMTVTLEDWIEYIQGECSAAKSERLEALLEQEENALELYMNALAYVEEQLPSLVEPDQFTDAVMAQLFVSSSETGVSSIEITDAKRRWYEHKLFHYAVAACLTLIFLSAGWFDKLSPEQLQKSDINKGSYSQELVRVTTGWIDRIKP